MTTTKKARRAREDSEMSRLRAAAEKHKNKRAISARELDDVFYCVERLVGRYENTRKIWRDDLERMTLRIAIMQKDLLL